MSDRKVILLSLGAILFVMAGLLALPFYFERQLHNELEIGGYPVDADVVGRDKEYDEGWSYWVDYVYVDNLGEEREGSASVSESEYEAFVPGKSQLPVLYMPEDPALHATRADIESGIASIIFFVSLGVAVFGLALAVGGLFS